MAEKINKQNIFGLNTEEMMKSGLHLGHKVSKLHPKMNPYISGIKNNIHVVDLDQTLKKFNEALEFIQKIVSEGKTILLVGTKIHLKELVKKTAEECGAFYVSERWLGGTLTNFKTLQKRIEYFKDLERKKESGELEKYTKKERIDIDRELQNLKIKFEGIKNMEKLPDAIFVVDLKKDALAAKEARDRGVKVVGIVDTNIDPVLADYPIPASDDSIPSVSYILEKIKSVITNTKPKAKEEKNEK